MTGGGAATNSGIDFQHRIGATAMLTMLTDSIGLSWLLRGIDDFAVDEVRFETSDGVDDLVVVTDGPRIFVQAKRALDLSSSVTSEFSSTIRQFVKQWRQGPGDEAMFVLATSSSASRRITADLRKLTEAARLNELGATENPLSKAEQRVLKITHELIEHHAEEIGDEPIAEEERFQILRRIHVAELGLEDGGPLERAVLAVLGSRALIPPALVWGNLVALALRLAKERASVDRAALEERFGDFFEKEGIRASTEAEEEGLRLVMSGQLSAGREVVLVSLGDRSLLAELNRFEDDGTPRFRFTDGEIDLGQGVRGTLIRRSATMSGMQRMILDDPSLIEGEELLLAPMNSDVDPDQSSWAQAHAELMAQALRENLAPLQCFQCGRPISEEAAPAIEVDQAEEPRQVGMVHGECLQPAHRVLGRISGGALQSHPFLRDFDYAAWFRSLPTGQGAFRSTTDAIRARLPILGWKPGQEAVAIGEWGVAYQLEDGSERYVSQRGRVARLGREEAEEQARFMDARLKEAGDDPWCVNDAGFGAYSELLRTDPGSQPVRVEAAEARKLTPATLATQGTVDNWYAPVAVLLNADTAAPFMVNGARVVLTDPLRLPAGVENWSAAGLDIPRLTTSVLSTDAQFDVFVSRAIRDSVGVVVDPMLDLRGVLASGFRLGDVEPLLEAAKE